MNQIKLNLQTTYNSNVYNIVLIRKLVRNIKSRKNNKNVDEILC